MTSQINITTSPYHVYHLTSPKFGSSACKTNECHLKTTFHWKRYSICQAKLICTQLSDNVCGDYGLSMNSLDPGTNLSAEQPICFANSVFESNLNPKGSVIELDLWFDSEATFNASCYFWCSPNNGSVPRRPQMKTNSSIYQDYPDLITIDLNQTTETVVGLSPVKIYRVTMSQAKCFQDIKCNWNQTLQDNIL
jgi:hypothetical protein